MRKFIGITTCLLIVGFIKIIFFMEPKPSVDKEVSETKKKEFKNQLKTSWAKDQIKIEKRVQEFMKDGSLNAKATEAAKMRIIENKYKNMRAKMSEYMNAGAMEAITRNIFKDSENGKRLGKVYANIRGNHVNGGLEILKKDEDFQTLIANSEEFMGEIEAVVDIFKTPDPKTHMVKMNLMSTVGMLEIPDERKNKFFENVVQNIFESNTKMMPPFGVLEKSLLFYGKSTPDKSKVLDLVEKGMEMDSFVQDEIRGTIKIFYDKETYNAFKERYPIL